MNFDDYFESFRGKTVAVAGYGVSNRPIIPFLLEHGAKVTVYDKKSVGELGRAATEDCRRGVVFVCGEKYLERVEGDVIFRSPGIHPAILQGRASLLTSEAEAFFAVSPCPIIGVTGSDGKSTTTTLISKILTAAGYQTHLGGNIGTPLLPLVPTMRAKDVAVMELSSFQLMTMRRSPDVAVITNITPNHLDIHRDMNEYIDAKRNIFRYQKPGSRLVRNLDNPITANFLAAPNVESVGFSLAGRNDGGRCVYMRDGYLMRAGEKLFAADRILLPGRHNIENYMAALAAVDGMAKTEDALAVAESFGGVAHRLELVREKDGIRYYNSSIDSSPTRTNAALSVFAERGEKVVCILGGYDKHLDYAPLHDPVSKACAAVVLMGATADKIDAAIDPLLRRERAADMREAVWLATRLAKQAGSHAVLLSPASASFDLFKNFEERGNVFCALVKEL